MKLHAHHSHQAVYKVTQNEVLRIIRTAAVPLKSIKEPPQKRRVHCLLEQREEGNINKVYILLSKFCELLCFIAGQNRAEQSDVAALLQFFIIEIPQPISDDMMIYD